MNHARAEMTSDKHLGVCEKRSAEARNSERTFFKTSKIGQSENWKRSLIAMVNDNFVVKNAFQSFLPWNMMLHRAWLELRKLANRIHHRSRGNLLVVERARALPAMQPQQLLVSWDLLEELATAWRTCLFWLLPCQDCSTPWISTNFGSWSKGGSVQPVGSMVTDQWVSHRIPSWMCSTSSVEPCFQSVNLQANAPLSISTKKEQPKRKEKRPGELAFYIISSFQQIISLATRMQLIPVYNW